MTTTENPSQSEEVGTVLDRSFFIPGKNISEAAGFTGDIARLTLEACQYGSLVDCGTLEMRLLSPASVDNRTLKIAGGFKSAEGFNNRRSTWTWDVQAKIGESSLHLISDVDLTESEGNYKFEVQESDESIIAVPTGGPRNLPNLWHQVSPDQQGRLRRQNFVYDPSAQIADCISRTFEKGIVPSLDGFIEERKQADDEAATRKISFYSDLHVAANAVGFRGTTGLINVDHASPEQILSHSTKAERVLTFEELPAALAATFNAIFPVIECPIAVLEKCSKTKKLDIKALEQVYPHLLAA